MSNFHSASVEMDSVIYPTVEHAYQAAKTLDRGLRVGIRNAPTPREARRIGRSLKVRSDWIRVKDDIMLSLLRKKFGTEDLEDRLLQTEDAELIEGNSWGDTYWGKVDGEGLNRLGELLMQVRIEASERWCVMREILRSLEEL